jgi:serine/threonine protein kinase
VPPGEEAFGPWLADKISRSEELTHLHLLDPTGSIFCSQDFGEEFVALKTNLLDPTGQTEVPPGILREIDVLQSFAHRHVVRLLDVFCSPTKSTLVFELMERNLRMYMRRNGPLSPDSVKGFMKQLMLGMEYVHSCGVMHRDMGPQNLLVGEGANLKIGGFGLSRRVTIPGGVYTHEVITVWYRPLEILLGDKTYNLSVDMWSCGCILGEMALNRPLFPCRYEIGVIFKIFAKLGTPTEQQWKGLENLPDFKRSFPKWSRTPLGADQDLFAQLGREGLELLEGLLQYDPAERTSARTALQLDYLSS